MTPTMNHRTTLDAIRAQEVYRYYQPSNPTEAPPTAELSTEEASKSAPSHILLDTALTAFTQLIAIHFSAQRAIVSLTDHQHEYFLAESTSSLNLLDPEPYLRNQFLSMGGSKVTRNASLCEQTLCIAPNREKGTLPAFVVPDLRLNGKLSHLECVKGAPYLRFYCGVALTNNKNITIGSVYVVDDTARSEVTFDQIQFLTTMAVTVMDYMENIRVKEEIVRVTRMSQGLHAFIEGVGTMHGDWKRLNRYSLPAGAGVGYSWKSVRVDVDESQNSKRPDSTRKVDKDKSIRPGHLTERALPLPYRLDGIAQEDGKAVTGKDSLFPTDSYFSHGMKVGQHHSHDAVSSLLDTIFFRASNLIKEGMEVDGAVFFGTPVVLFQHHITSDSKLPELDNSVHSESGSSRDGEDCSEVRPGSPSHVIHSAYPLLADSHPLEGCIHVTDEPGPESNILGFSAGKHTSLNGHKGEDTNAFLAMNQNLLTSLVRHYPAGKLFTFDHQGPISHQRKTAIFPETFTVGMKQKRHRHKARKRAEIISLLAVFPKARHILFIPLYDSLSKCFIGSFTWSTSSTRIFSIENDLSYLKAFGHSVMTEVNRLNSLSVDRAKDQFVNNVSHELRSPLHGILASAEFLADTSMDGFQRSLVDNIDGCGRALLDTIEHILDFSKIKKFSQKTKESMGIVAEVDISAVIEEVVEGICAGFETYGLSSQGLADTRDVSDTRNDIQGLKAMKIVSKDNVRGIILDIDFREQWRFPTAPGTWRRVAMNLFSNALKYTPEGWIKVQLEARNASPVDLVQSDGKERTIVILTISDSGRGISGDFLENKLFVPFSQEDVTTPGTGLGMSIVKELVDLAGGTIDVRSDLGKGTQVKLSIPVENHLDQLMDEPDTANLASEISEDPVIAVRRRARKKTVYLRGFDSHSGTGELQSQSLDSLKSSIEKYIREWFNLSLVSNESRDHIAADIVILDESAFLDSASLAGNELLRQGQIVLIFCSNGARHGENTTGMTSERIVEFISKPCGPRRLAKALLACLDKEADNKADAEKVNLRDLDAFAEKRHPIGILAGALTKTVPSPADGSIIVGEEIVDLKSMKECSQPAMNLSITPRVDLSRDSKSNYRSVLSPNRSSESDTTPASSTHTSSLTKNDSGSSSPSSSATSAHRNVPPKPSSSEISPARRKVLLVEDNPVNMMLLSTYMRKNNWPFESGENGQLALQTFESRPQGFDVIFMDVSMPIMSGYEATRAIRAVEHARRLSGGVNPPALIIALTGFSSQKDQEMAFESGMDIFMTKPVRFREVGRILDMWMRGN